MAEGYQGDSYIAALTTGVLAAALAADAPIAAIRNGPTQVASAIQGGLRSIFITEIGIKLSSITAFTAAQQFGFYTERFSAANLAGGAAANISKRASGQQASVALSGGAEGGDTRVATTAALTVVGVTFAADKVPVYSWSTVGPAEYSDDVISFADAPIRLAPGEGLAIRNLIVWPAAGTAVANIYIKYFER